MILFFYIILFSIFAEVLVVFFFFQSLSISVASRSVQPFLYDSWLVGWQEGHPACKKTEWWGAGVVISVWSKVYSS